MLCAVYLVMHLPFDTSQTLQTCTDHVREKASDKILDDEYWLVLDFFFNLWFRKPSVQISFTCSVGWSMLFITYSSTS